MSLAAITLAIFGFIGSTWSDAANVVIAWDKPAIAVDSYEVIDNGRRLGITTELQFVARIETVGLHVIEVKSMKDGQYSPAAYLLLYAQ